MAHWWDSNNEVYIRFIAQWNNYPMWQLLSLLRLTQRSVQFDQPEVRDKISVMILVRQIHCLQADEQFEQYKCHLNEFQHWNSYLWRHVRCCYYSIASFFCSLHWRIKVGRYEYLCLVFVTTLNKKISLNSLFISANSTGR